MPTHPSDKNKDVRWMGHSFVPVGRLCRWRTVPCLHPAPASRPRSRSSVITRSTFQSSAPVPSTVRSACAAEAVQTFRLPAAPWPRTGGAPTPRFGRAARCRASAGARSTAHPACRCTRATDKSAADPGSKAQTIPRRSGMRRARPARCGLHARVRREIVDRPLDRLATRQRRHVAREQRALNQSRIVEVLPQALFEWKAPRSR